MNVSKGTTNVNPQSWASICAGIPNSQTPSSHVVTSHNLLAGRANMKLNAKGADAFKSTTNPILDLFTQPQDKIPENIVEFTSLVRKIEAAKNFDSEMFVKLLKFHRLIGKGNGMKGIYYISMMILKNENTALYEQVLSWSYQYPKDILRLARLSSMFGCAPSTTGTKVSIPMSLRYVDTQGNTKGTLGKKMTKWALTEYHNSRLTPSHSRRAATSGSTTQIQSVKISAEVELYANQLAHALKKVMTGKLYDSDVNLMFFKYLSYETGHFAVESKVIWSFVEEILRADSVTQAALDAYGSGVSVAHDE
jgi:hypothetical protein